MSERGAREGEEQNRFFSQVDVRCRERRRRTTEEKKLSSVKKNSPGDLLLKAPEGLKVLDGRRGVLDLDVGRGAVGFFFFFLGRGGGGRGG